MARNEVTGFNCIATRELPTWIKVLKLSDDIHSPQDMLQELNLIDDLLVLQKSQCLMRRKRKTDLKLLIDKRIEYDLGLDKKSALCQK